MCLVLLVVQSHQKVLYDVDWCGYILSFHWWPSQAQGSRGYPLELPSCFKLEGALTGGIFLVLLAPLWAGLVIIPQDQLIKTHDQLMSIKHNFHSLLATVKFTTDPKKHWHPMTSPSPRHVARHFLLLLDQVGCPSWVATDPATPWDHWKLQGRIPENPSESGETNPSPHK